MIRRLSALVAALLLLNVSAAEALRVCADAERHQDVAAAAITGHEHHAPAAPAPADEDGEDCETTQAARCCDAMSSCGPSLSLDGASGESGVMPDDDAALAGDHRAPAAQVFSPEPPPPKA